MLTFPRFAVLVLGAVMAHALGPAALAVLVAVLVLAALAGLAWVLTATVRPGRRVPVVCPACDRCHGCGQAQLVPGVA